MPSTHAIRAATHPGCPARVPAAALAVLFLALPAHPAAAATRPLPPEPCGALARRLSLAIHLPVATAVGATRAVSDLAPAGDACLLTGRGTGLTQTLADALAGMEAVTKGWQPDNALAADGPDETQAGFRRGHDRFLYSLAVEPPKGTCASVILADCKVPAKRWRWSFKAAAYRE